MISEKKTANAIGGKTARACESCLNKRARWYCAADDAFLCQACDVSVHSANQLACRHERVRLETASFKPPVTIELVTPPLWHKGFTRKTRTPRHNKAAVLGQRDKLVDDQNPVVPFVPENGSEDQLGFLLDHENEEHLLHRVPVFDPFDADFCPDVSIEEVKNIEIKCWDQTCDNHEVVGNGDDDPGAAFLPSEGDLAEFISDVESLLERPEHDEDRRETGLLVGYCKEEEDEIDIAANYFGGETLVQVKTEDQMDQLAANSGYDDHVDPSFSLFRSETLDWNYFDHSDHDQEVLMLEKDGEMKEDIPMITRTEYKYKDMKRRIFLRLNYEEVITAWDGQSSPWVTGKRPDFDPDQNYWSDCLGTWERHNVHNQYGSLSGNSFQRNGEINDGGREARVSRYREKRRTRLFSKKIRYEVRKLNAEKRPRLKGRFVKRTPFIGTTTTHINAFPNYHPTK